MIESSVPSAEMTSTLGNPLEVQSGDFQSVIVSSSPL